MKSTGKFSDQRVKKGLFPLSTFVLFFLLFALLTTLQMVMIGQVIDYKSLPAQNVAAVLGFWVVITLSIIKPLIAGTFAVPVATRTTHFAAKISPIPMVIALVGTSSFFSKKRALALMVLSVKVSM